MAGKLWIVFGFTIKRAAMYVEDQLIPLYKHNPIKPVVNKDSYVLVDVYDNPIVVQCASSIRKLRAPRPDILFIDRKIVTMYADQSYLDNMTSMAKEVVVYEV